MRAVIDQFTGEYSFLSNFYPATIVTSWDLECAYPTAEHAFQAQKTFSLSRRQRISEAATPGDAKRMGKALPEIRRDWEREKRRIMLEILLDKFEGHPDLMAKLLGTSPAVLVEGNTWGDTYWGAIPGPGTRNEQQLLWRGSDGAQYQGLNWLGKLLMMVREIYLPA